MDARCHLQQEMLGIGGGREGDGAIYPAASRLSFSRLQQEHSPVQSVCVHMGAFMQERHEYFQCPRCVLRRRKAKAKKERKEWQKKLVTG
jgi:hypothetical protein